MQPSWRMPTLSLRDFGRLVKGPAIQGEIIAPTGDWLRVMPNGTEKLDVRMSIPADDGAIIFVTYTGKIVTHETKSAGGWRGNRPD